MFRAPAQFFGGGHGLSRLGADELGQVLPPVFAYWRELGRRHVTALCTRPDVEGRRVAVPSPSEEELAVHATAAPMMPGDLTAEVLGALRRAIGAAFAAEYAEHAESGATVQEFLKRLNLAWKVVGRVHFYLAANRDEEAPFAFLATYTSRLSTRAGPASTPRARHSASTRLRPSGSGAPSADPARCGALNAQWIPEHLPLLKTHRECLK
jgi:hypothetical protein